MKVLTKLVEMDNRKFVLIEDDQNGIHFYGTIPYTELNEKGGMKRALNGFEMCISVNSIGEALENRNKQNKVDDFKAAGHSKAEVLMFVANGYTEENWDEEKLERFKAIAE